MKFHTDVHIIIIQTSKSIRDQMYINIHTKCYAIGSGHLKSSPCDTESITSNQLLLKSLVLHFFSIIQWTSFHVVIKKSLLVFQL